MDPSDVLTLALALFLVITGIALGYLLYRMAQLFQTLSASLVRSTDEVVPILSRAQETVDGINREIGRVDDIMVSAVGATKGAEKAVTSVAHGVSAPVRKLSGLAAGVQEAVATFRSRRAADAADARARGAMADRPGATEYTPPAPAGPVSPAPPPTDAWAEERARRQQAAEAGANGDDTGELPGVAGLGGR